MVIAQQRRGIWNFRRVFFPTSEECEMLLKTMRINDVLDVHQTVFGVAGRPELVKSSAFRTTVIDLTKDLDSIKGGMDAKSCRYEIRRAERTSADTEVHSNDRVAYSCFPGMFNRLMSQKGVKRFMSNSEFDSYLDVSDVFVVCLRGVPTCGHLVVRDSSVGRASLIFSASTRLQGKEESAASAYLNRWLHWYEIQWYKAMGFRLYDLGGVTDPPNSVSRFKLSFGGIVIVEAEYLFSRWPGRLGLRMKALFRTAVK